MTRVALAASSELALQVGSSVASLGGSSVDVAIAASIAAMVTEPGVCAPGAGGFLTIGGRGVDPVVYDGYMAVPGLGAPHGPGSTITASMEYGGGITTLVGPGSVATPGAWAALGLAHRERGSLAWEDLVLPSAQLAQDGFPLGATSRYYLGYSHEVIFGHDPASHAALHRDGRLMDTGDLIVMPDLAASLEAIAHRGASWFHTGGLAAAIAADMADRGGLVTAEDLARYRAVRRTPVQVAIDGFTLSSNPAPAVGGAAVTAMVADFLAGERTPADMVRAQQRVFEWRRLPSATEIERNHAVEQLVHRFDSLTSPSTIHISAVDATGLACSITMSAGYGSGVIPTGTGMWMNNALGELELVGRNLIHLVPGERLSSNMAPSVVVRPDGEVLAVGSPGANRITTAIAQTVLGFCVDGLSLEEAVGAPRIHVEVDPELQVAAEPGADLTGVDLPARSFEQIHMFFGGVGAAHLSARGELEAVSDPRRNGAAAVVS